MVARKKQLIPDGDWRRWLILSGRGWGKTRVGAETVRHLVETGQAKRIGLIAPIASDARDVMIEGESGILSVCPPWDMPIYEPSKRRLTWKNGAIATAFSADIPERLRGHQTDFIWMDELASWRYYEETYDMAMFGLRLGANPRAIITTTPKPIKIVKDLVTDASTVVTTGTTYENKKNLAQAFIDVIIQKYEGTRLGQQEIYGDILSDIEGALWNRAMLEELRIKKSDTPNCRRIVVAIDPATTHGAESSETGIIVAGLGEDGHGYVLDDLSGKYSPDGWAKVAVEAYERYKADRIVAEANQGGDMVEYVIRTLNSKVAYKKVHASKGKHTRAEPISALYEQKKVHHLGFFSDLEEQMCTWVSDSGQASPDRVDALVWAFTELMLNKKLDLTTLPKSLATASRWR